MTTDGAPGAHAREKPRRPLRRKYFVALFAAVAVPLAINGASEAWFGYRGQRALLDQRLGVESRAAALRIGEFFEGVVAQLRWAVQQPWVEPDLDRRRLDALRILRLTPPIAEIHLVDDRGVERLSVARIAFDRQGVAVDRTGDPAVIGARTRPVWYGPVAFRQESEPHMTVALGGDRRGAGLVLAEVDLRLIFDLVAAIAVGGQGGAFVVDHDGSLIAHRDASLVLRGTDAAGKRAMAELREATTGGRTVVTRDPAGRRVVAAAAQIAGVEWTVFVAEPVGEAFAPIRDALWRTGLLVVAGAGFAALLAFWLARRMTGPIRALEQGADRIGAGQFDHRIAIRTGDELQRLAERFNAMAVDLAESRERSERIARLKRFLSPQVAELVERAGSADLLAGQRAEVVVLFADLRGFTAFSARAAPEVIMRVLAAYYEALGAIITRHEATLTHFAADGLMVLLNAPVPCPDEPAARAVRLARDMVGAVARLGAGWSAAGHGLGFGIGAAFGEATVGRIGYEGRHDYTAIGPVANLAARLCGAADDRQILVDAALARRLGPDVGAVSQGRRGLKGLAEPVEVYAVPSAS
jgi:adenylate cyclase